MLLTENRKFIAYYRVSTHRQGVSGLGLEAQKASVTQFANGNGELLGEFTEVETGKRSDRPQLLKAIAQTKRSGATLVIAKLDRLARNVAFISSLMDSGVDFIACDNQHANRLTIHILAAVAEDEARRISIRTKDALAAYKARGGKLGSHHPKCKALSAEASRKGQKIGSKRNQENAREAYADLFPMILQLRGEGASLREVARQLNEEGHSTRSGGKWNPVQVQRVIRLSTES
jgi:DNA invertase Pin-like site-specific DNA recombinase